MASNEVSALAIRRVTYDKILLFGDSLTELSSDVLTLSFAITPALQHHYFRKLAVVARGYGGYSSEHLRHVLLPTIRAETAAGEKIRLLVLEVGTNDAAMNDAQSVPISRYRENLQWMVKTAMSAGVERVVIVGLGAVAQEMLESPADKSTKRNSEYSEAASAVAEELGLPFVDLWHAFMSTAGWQEGQDTPDEQSNTGKALESLLTDGVHFSGSGYRVWYDELLGAIRTSFPELKTESLPSVLPHIYAIDRKNLPDTLWQDVSVDDV